MNNISVSVMANLVPTQLPLTQRSADPESFLNLVTGATPAKADPLAKAENPAGLQPALPTPAIEAAQTTTPAPEYNGRAADLTNVPRFALPAVAAAPTLADPLVQNTPTEPAAEPKLPEGPAYSFPNASVGVPMKVTATNQAIKNEISNILACLPVVAIVERDEQKSEADIATPGVEPPATMPLALLMLPITNKQFFASQGDEKTNVAAAPDKVGTQFIAPVELPPKPASFQFPELINWTSTALPNPSTAKPSDIALQPGTTAILDLAQDSLWLDRLAKEIASFASHDGRLRFSLSPPALGDLDVAIQTEGDGVNIQLQPSTESAARIFAAEQPKLVEELRQSGVRLNNSDLLGGHQSQGYREHSHTQNPARQLADRSSPHKSAETNPSTRLSERRDGKFA